MSETNKTVIRRFYEDIWNPRKVKLLPDVLADNVVFRGSFDIELEGIEEFQEHMDMVHTGFPDFCTTIEELVAEGDSVAARLTYTGTHHGEVFHIPPTGRYVRYHGAAFFTLKEGKILKGSMLGDIVGMLDQLLLEDIEEEVKGGLM